MDRRSFLRTAGATALMPLLPAPSFAGAGTVATVNEFQMGWVTMFARANNRASPALIQKWLRIGPNEANAVMRELVSRGVVQAPIAGSAIAVDPLYPGGRPPGFITKGRNIAEKVVEMLTEEESRDSESEEIGIDPAPEDQEVVTPRGEDSHGLDGVDIG